MCQHQNLLSELWSDPPVTPLNTCPLVAMHNTVPHCTAPHCTALHCTAPHQTAPHQTAPHHTAPNYTAPHNTAPYCTAPRSTALHSTVPLSTASHCTLSWQHVCNPNYERIPGLPRNPSSSDWSQLPLRSSLKPRQPQEAPASTCRSAFSSDSA